LRDAHGKQQSAAVQACAEYCRVQPTETTTLRLLTIRWRTACSDSPWAMRGHVDCWSRPAAAEGQRVEFHRIGWVGHSETAGSALKPTGQAECHRDRHWTQREHYVGVHGYHSIRTSLVVRAREIEYLRVPHRTTRVDHTHVPQRSAQLTHGKLRGDATSERWALVVIVRCPCA
jgi:hypothetical protein